ncbi:hypothetical protein E3A20_12220 [Planctomyces bekefii]|uniref:Uncharacterized protein n=1 Tax=Planctomyces bekefii TaxID=1653850 RepID=A0A5C6M9N9_9PLAN|nr:hypothetical protein E3A20_12220 [Planctomyces bekefii]
MPRQSFPTSIRDVTLKPWRHFAEPLDMRNSFHMDRSRTLLARLPTPRAAFHAFILAVFAFASSPLWAQAATDTYDDEESSGIAAKTGAKDEAQQAQDAEKLNVASSNHVRRFHEVLDELLAEFGYDVKMGQIKGLSNLAVRKIRVSPAIPKTYEDYLEVLLNERIRENSQVRLIACVPCKTRTSSLVDGKLMITSPATNMAKLEAAAQSLGIEYFMDAVLVYHTTHMVLALNVFNAQTKEMVWARTYNSETVKSRYQKLAIDYSQVAKSRPGEDYVPDYRVMIGFGGAAIPNVAGTKEDSTMLNLQIRATEKFNNRHDEFGMLFSLLKTTSSTLNAYPTIEPNDGSATSTDTEEDLVTEPTPKPFQMAFGIYGVYSHLFLGSVESYNEARSGMHVGMGGLFSTGYLAPLLRAGWDIYFGKRFSTSFSGCYVASSTILVSGESVKTKGGAGVDVIMSFNF